jgi:hypothetical protein
MTTLDLSDDEERASMRPLTRRIIPLVISAQTINHNLPELRNTPLKLNAPVR